ncbi:MAG: hypothetical protein V2J20_09980, partial [Wenzhouxiangella sp.]|nr:hypothetical protein [Wenzhouxiangella sp.]
MKLSALNAVKSGSNLTALLLIGVGLFSLLAAAVAWYGASSGSRAVSAAESEAQDYVRQARDRLAAVQQRLASPIVQSAAVDLLEESDDPARALADLLISDGLTGITRIRIAPPALEDWSVDQGEDYVALDMLLEARRSGAAPAELRAAGAGGTFLLFAQRLQNNDQTEALVLVEMTADSLTSGWREPDFANYMSLGQDRGGGWLQVWSQGQPPGSSPERLPIGDSRLELRWFQSRPLPLFSAAQVGGLAGVGLLMLVGGVLLRKRALAQQEPVSAGPSREGEGPQTLRKTSAAAGVTSERIEPRIELEGSSSAEPLPRDDVVTQPEPATPTPDIKPEAPHESLSLADSDSGLSL